MDNTNTMAPVAVAETNNEKPKAEVIQKDGYTLEKVSFSGKKEGFEYYIPQYLTLDKVFELFGKGNVEDGKRLALGLLNGAVKQSFSGRATQRMPSAEKEEDTKKLIEAAKVPGAVDKNGVPLNLLITAQEAEEWIPGTRDRVSLLTLTREFQDALKKGDVDLAQELYAEIEIEQKRKLEEMLRMADALEEAPAATPA